MVTRIRRVNPVQFALVYALVYAMLFFVIAVPIGAIMAAITSQAGNSGTMPMMGGLAGGLLFFVIAIVYPVMGFVAAFVVGWIGAALYNLVAGWTGGIEMTLEQPVGARIPAGGATA